MSLSYSCKCEDFKEKTVGKVMGGKGGKYPTGILYLPKEYIGKRVVVLLEPEV